MDDYYKQLLAEHKLKATETGDGWDWSCSCGKLGHSALDREHWTDVAIKQIEYGELEHHGSVTERNQERKKILRELILGDIQEAEPGGD
jgi:hypothetical protein